MTEASASGSNERGQKAIPSDKSDRKVGGSPRARKRKSGSSGEKLREAVYGAGRRRRVVTFGGDLAAELKVTVGKSGRVTLPASVRNELDLHEGVELNVQVEDGELVLTPVVTVPRSYQWAYSSEHLDRLSGALTDAEDGRIRPLDEGELTQVLGS